jgi:outer membrane protein assembly factor BamB
MRRMITVVVVSAALFGAGSAFAQTKAAAGEWPGWRGADRTGVSTETGYLKAWPKAGPKLLWKADGLGEGYSTPSVSKGKVYVMGAKGGGESVICLDAKTGKTEWAARAGGGGGGGGYGGPRSTPAVDGTSVFAITSGGDIAAIGIADGKVAWTKSLPRDFGGQVGNWSYSESPLVDGDVVVCTPGGGQATLVALKKATGEPVWRCAVPGGDGAEYSSAIVAQMGASKQYIQFLKRGVVGVDSKTGRFLWRFDAPANGTANCSTPIFRNGVVFAASGYNRGGGAARVGPGSAQQVWFNPQFQNHHGGVVLVGNALYGTNNNTLMCVDFASGKTLWQDRSVGKGSIAYADGCLYVRSENGPVALVAASPAGYRELARFNQPDRSGRNSWAHPVVTGGRLYLRDQDILLCYDVSGR